MFRLLPHRMVEVGERSGVEAIEVKKEVMKVEPLRAAAGAGAIRPAGGRESRSVVVGRDLVVVAAGRANERRMDPLLGCDLCGRSRVDRDRRSGIAQVLASVIREWSIGILKFVDRLARHGLYHRCDVPAAPFPTRGTILRGRRALHVGRFASYVR